MFKRSFLLLFFYILCGRYSTAFSMENVIVNTKLSEKVIYSDVPAKNFKEFCNYAIEKIYTNPEGKRLIDKISSMLNESPIKAVKFVDSSGSSEGTAFVHGLDFSQNTEISIVPDTILKIHINLDNAIRCISSGTQWYDQLFGISECVYDTKKIDKFGDAFRIAKIFSPFYVIIAHELIHLKHFLETPLHKEDNSYVTYGEAVNMQTYMQISAENRLHTLPELKEREYTVKRFIPWNNFEERRTVVGPDIDGISELSFRIIECLPIRYIYQGPEEYFYEDPQVLYSIVKEALSLQRPDITIKDVKDIVTSSLPQGYLSEQESDFAKFSCYHPLMIQLVLFDDQKIIEAHRVQRTKKEQALKFLESKRNTTTEHPSSTT